MMNISATPTQNERFVRFLLSTSKSDVVARLEDALMTAQEDVDACNTLSQCITVLEQRMNTQEFNIYCHSIALFSH